MAQLIEECARQAAAEQAKNERIFLRVRNLIDKSPDFSNLRDILCLRAIIYLPECLEQRGLTRYGRRQLLVEREMPNVKQRQCIPMFSQRTADYTLGHHETP